MRKLGWLILAAALATAACDQGPDRTKGPEKPQKNQAAAGHPYSPHKKALDKAKALQRINEERFKQIEEMLEEEK
jgi:hypothetical protein